MLKIFAKSVALLGAALLGAALFGGSAIAKSPIVVELFTSQGCSSCPPAEAYMRDLAKRQDVIGLEYHVDYWDYIGWKDKFADPAFTGRQRSYVRAMGSRYAYTPQMVINGRTHAVGSDRRKVENIIRESRERQTDGPEIVLRRDGQTLQISVGAASAGGAYDVVFVTFDKPHETEVRRGENRGRTLVNANVVRVLQVIGPWTGQPVEYSVSLVGKKGDGGCAVIVQKRGHGPVVAASSMPFEH
jgi:hypothetical protein